jgi:hypothetical protein
LHRSLAVAREILSPRRAILKSRTRPRLILPSRSSSGEPPNGPPKPMPAKSGIFNLIDLVHWLLGRELETCH